MPSTSSLLYSLALLSSVASAHPTRRAFNPDHNWGLKKFSSLVAFGDSYTDESRLGYFGSHNGDAPPVGWVQPESTHTASGGRSWVRFVAQNTGVNLYNYAVSGAVCSNDISPRIWNQIHAPFPAVKNYEIPAFIADSQYVESNGTKFLDVPMDETVYAMWIGTNDLGSYAFLTDSQVAGKTIVDYTNCVFNQLKRLYNNGARYFVLMNAAPLNLSPLYGLPEAGGVGPNHFWPDKGSNLTEISYRMLESVVTVNNIYKFQLPFQVVVKNMFPDAHFALYDVHSLWTDIYNNPANYLNGTAPPNVTGYVRHCDIRGGNCVDEESPDSFMWYDELHPGEQMERVIASNFVDIVNGRSEWATYWT